MYDTATVTYPGWERQAGNTKKFQSRAEPRPKRRLNKYDLSTGRVSKGGELVKEGIAEVQNPQMRNLEIEPQKV